MKIIVVPSAFGPAEVSADQHLTSYIINGTVAIDAGAIGFFRSPAQQAAIRHIFLSHTHLDHLASLPSFLENTASLTRVPVTVHASAPVQECLRNDFFNERLWPNFLELTHDNQPFMKLETLESGRPVQVEGLRITPVAVDHVVPTLGFIIEDRSSAVIVTSDTGPTEEIWRQANRTPNLKGIFLEAAFPNDHAWLADISKHLTTAGFAGETRKVTAPATFYAVHLKAGFRERIIEELRAQDLPNAELARFGFEYEF